MSDAKKADYEMAKKLKVGEVYTPKGWFGGEYWIRCTDETILYSADGMNWSPKYDHDFQGTDK